MKIILTGSEGMLGKRFLEMNEKLNEEKQIICTDFDLVEEKPYQKIDIKDDFIVVHIAGQKGSDKSFLLRNNITATSQLLNQLCLKDNCKGMIFISSIAVFGLQDYVITEDSPRLPDNYYGFTKKVCEEMIEETLKDKQYIILRPTNIFSKDRSTMVGNLLYMIEHQETFNAWEESLRVKRDYIFIDDVVEGINNSIELIETSKIIKKELNLAGGNSYSLSEIINILEKLTQKELPLIIEKAKGFRGKDLIIESDKSRKNLEYMKIESAKFMKYIHFKVESS